MVFSLTWLPDVLENAGLKVAEVSGWRARGHGDVASIKGVMCHHTAGALKGNMPSLGLLANGRPGLDGPLCQLGLGRDGTYYVVAAGRAFHAGRGVFKGVSTGNSSFIGIEAENTGFISGPKADFPWPPVQLDAYARGVAAILKKIGATADMCCGHKEYATPSGRKPDPTFDADMTHHDDMDRFRATVAAIMIGSGPVRDQIPPKDDKGRPTLRRGAKDDLVKVIQKKLGVSSTGFFGATTEAAVREFQRMHTLVPDGIVGPKTWPLLDALP